MHPVHNLLPYFDMIHSNIINIAFRSTTRFSKWSLPFMFSNQNIVCISYLAHAYYTSRPPHPPWFHHPKNIWWSAQLTKLLVMQSFPASRPFVPITYQSDLNFLVKAVLIFFLVLSASLFVVLPKERLKQLTNFMKFPLSPYLKQLPSAGPVLLPRWENFERMIIMLLLPLMYQEGS
jgi:hypothetical protein